MSTRLAPLSEEPVINEIEEEEELSKKGRKKWKKWIKNNLLLLSQQSLFLLLFNKKSEDDIKILLSVLGCPLLPVSSSSPPLILTPSLPHQVSTSQLLITYTILVSISGSVTVPNCYQILYVMPVLVLTYKFS